MRYVRYVSIATQITVDGVTTGVVVPVPLAEAGGAESRLARAGMAERLMAAAVAVSAEGRGEHGERGRTPACWAADGRFVGAPPRRRPDGAQSGTDAAR